MVNYVMDTQFGLRLAVLWMCVCCRICNFLHSDRMIMDRSSQVSELAELAASHRHMKRHTSMARIFELPITNMYPPITTAANEPFFRSHHYVTAVAPSESSILLGPNIITLSQYQSMNPSNNLQHIENSAHSAEHHVFAGSVLRFNNNPISSERNQRVAGDTKHLNSEPSDSEFQRLAVAQETTAGEEENHSVQEPENMVRTTKRHESDKSVTESNAVINQTEKSEPQAGREREDNTSSRMETHAPPSKEPSNAVVETAEPVKHTTPNTPSEHTEPKPITQHEASTTTEEPGFSCATLRCWLKGIGIASKAADLVIAVMEFVEKGDKEEEDEGKKERDSPAETKQADQQQAANDEEATQNSSEEKLLRHNRRFSPHSISELGPQVAPVNATAVDHVANAAHSDQNDRNNNGGEYYDNQIGLPTAPAKHGDDSQVTANDISYCGNNTYFASARRHCKWQHAPRHQMVFWRSSYFRNHSIICLTNTRSQSECLLVCEADDSCKSLHYCTTCSQRNCHLFRESVNSTRLPLRKLIPFVDYSEKVECSS